MSTISSTIYKIRTNAHLSQSEFAQIFDVSSQAVQKWESGASVPALDKLVQIAKRYGISLDALILGRSQRESEELVYHKKFTPQYADLHPWELYCEGLQTEYKQSIEEGLDVSAYKDLFESIAKLPKDEHKKRLADVLFDMVCDSKKIPDYAYREPSDIEGIRALRKPHAFQKQIPSDDLLKDKIYGAWLGRVCGCLLGKPIEGIHTEELLPILKESNNFPMHRYIISEDIGEERMKACRYSLADRCYADTVDGMPVDDDTNYTVLAQTLVETCGRDFSACDVANTWLALQSKHAYCTAERIAYCNFVKGYVPPQSAAYQNPYREWIGAQIRGDYFGYINPGDPETAADMAFRDASISHVKNGIYGEMFAAAMIACAASTDSILDIIRGGLAEIPATSRLFEAIESVIERYQTGVSQTDCFRYIHERFDEHDAHDWCHTISNAMIVAAALLYGNGDYGKSICMAVETGFDTDCNGATVGSILGMRCGAAQIPTQWTTPVQDRLHTSIFGVGTVSIKTCAEKTLRHIRRP